MGVAESQLGTEIEQANNNLNVFLKVEFELAVTFQSLRGTTKDVVRSESLRDKIVAIRYTIDKFVPKLANDTERDEAQEYLRKIDELLREKIG